jgi:hypothetical protein
MVSQPPKRFGQSVDGVKKIVLEFKAQLIAAKQAQDGKFCGGSLKTYSR